MARKHKLIDENPFAEVKIPTANVSIRQQFIDRDTFERLLSVANPTWRTIIAWVVNKDWRRRKRFRCNEMASNVAKPYSPPTR